MGYINKYFILFALSGLIGLGFLGVAYVNITDTDGIDVDEMHAHARHTGQQIHEVFSWFDEKKIVLVPENLTGIADKSLNQRILANNGLTLGMPLPIDLARRLENKVQNGVSIRFVSDSPLGPNNRSSANIDRALMAALDSNSIDSFEYIENLGIYSYVRPLTARISCISCHTNVPVGGFIGSMVIEIDPEAFIHAERNTKREILLMTVLASFFTMFLFYAIMFWMWRRQRKQGASVEHAQIMAVNMSQDIELALGNMGHVLKELGQCVDDIKRTELLNSLKNINKDLLDTSFKLQAGDSRGNYEEEVFHVEELITQCVLLFQPNCNEKGLDLTLKVDPSVPSYLLGDAYHLKQALGRLVKYSVLYTKKGGVGVSVRAIEERTTNLSAKVQSAEIISLIVEIEDTGTGFMVTDKQSLLQGFAQSKGKSSSRPIISLTPVNEIAAIMNGSVTMPSNSKQGSCFRLVVQMKAVDEKRAALQHQLQQVQQAQQAQQTIGGVNASEDAKKQAKTKGSQAEQAVPDTPEELGPVSIIIADSSVEKFSDKAIKMWNQDDFFVTHMKTAESVCEALKLENHGFSVVIIRAVDDIDVLTAAIKIRQSMPEEASYVAIVLLSEAEIQTDLEVLHFFNISMLENAPRDDQLVIQVVNRALGRHKNLIFHGDKVMDKSYPETNANKIFNMRRALEHAKGNQKMVNSKCSMWVHFYPTQMERTQSLIAEDSEQDVVRLLKSLKNSANTVSLPLLYAEANRLETNILNGKAVRYEKLLAVYEHTYNYMKEHFD